MHPRFSKIHQNVTSAADGITACCAEYKLACDWVYPNKTIFLPLPYDVKSEEFVNTISSEGKLIYFLGKQGYRAAIKGMDVIEKALLSLKNKYPDDVEVIIVDSIPYDEYRKLMDQLILFVINCIVMGQV